MATKPEVREWAIENAEGLLSGHLEHVPVQLAGVLRTLTRAATALAVLGSRGAAPENSADIRMAILKLVSTVQEAALDWDEAMLFAEFHSEEASC